MMESVYRSVFRSHLFVHIMYLPSVNVMPMGGKHKRGVNMKLKMDSVKMHRLTLF